MSRQATLSTVYGHRQDRYLELIRKFPLRPIDDDEDLEQAISVVDQLLDQKKLTPPEQDYLEVLGNLIKTYEERTLPVNVLNDSQMLQALLDLKEVSQKELAKETGISESTISEVIKGSRTLNRRHIGKLANYFEIDPGVFDFSAGGAG